MRSEVEWVVVGCDGNDNAKWLAREPALAAFGAGVGVEWDHLASVTPSLVGGQPERVHTASHLLSSLPDSFAGLSNDQRSKRCAVLLY